MRNRLTTSITSALIVVGLAALTAGATPSPNGPGQPGAPGTTCQQYTRTPGNSGTASGSPYNPSGTAGNNYAGNPGTASAGNSKSSKSVSQYDAACFQKTTNHQ